MTKQLDVPGTEPEHPHIRDAIYAWLDEKDTAASEGKRLRDRAKAAEQNALELLAEAGLKSFRYLDRATGKWKRFLGVTETKAKTKTASGGDERARQGDESQEPAPMKPSRTKRVAVEVESRRVPRTAEHDQAADPFAATRSQMEDL